ncbi:MAG: hypothetical protein P1U44_11675 [Vicingaceae bacterium]|nr:hypothetical protein [Vicingaceae bacterium]
MYEFLNYITENIWIKIAAYVFTFVGGILTALSLRRKKIKPVYIMRSTSLLQESVSKLDGLNIEYDNHPVGNLTVTNIAIWNAGKKTLHQTDVSTNESISIKPKKNIVVYRYSTLKESSPSNGFSVQTNADNSALEIDFEYMDCNQGIAIQLVHSGISSTDIEVGGSIKGYGRIKSHEGEFKTAVMTNMLESPIGKLRPKKEDKKGILKVMIIVSCILLGTALFAPPLFMSSYWEFMGLSI